MRIFKKFQQLVKGHFLFQNQFQADDESEVVVEPDFYMENHEKCDNCDYTSTNKWSLQKHLQSMPCLNKHGMEKCPKCGFATQNKHNFKKHIYSVPGKHPTKTHSHVQNAHL